MNGGEYLSPSSRSKQQALLGLSPQKSPCEESWSRRTQSQGADGGEMSVTFAFYPCSVMGFWWGFRASCGIPSTCQVIREADMSIITIS